MPSQWWSRMCTSQMMGVTPGRRCWKDPTITPSWIPEASLWPLSTAATLSMWLSMHELRSTHTVCGEGNCGMLFCCGADWGHGGWWQTLIQLCAIYRTVGNILEGIATHIQWLCFFFWLPLANSFRHFLKIFFFLSTRILQKHLNTLDERWLLKYKLYKIICLFRSPFFPVKEIL